MSTTGKARDTIRIVPLPGIPEVERGSSLARFLIEAAARAGVGISDGDVVAVAQKIISKSEGRLAQLEEIEPSTEAIKQAPKDESRPTLPGSDPGGVEARRSGNRKSLDLRDPSRLDLRQRGSGSI